MKTKSKTPARKRTPSKPALAAVTSVVLHYWPHVLQVEVNGEEQPHRREPIPSDASVTKTAKAWSENGATVSIRKFDATGAEVPFQPELL